MPRMPFSDTVTLYEVTYSEDYGKPTLSGGTSVAAAWEQSTGMQHGDFQDGVTSDGRLYLDPDNAFLTTKGYRIEGLIAKINLFGASDRDQYFELTNVSVIRDTLLGNQVRHIETDLKKVADLTPAAIS